QQLLLGEFVTGSPVAADAHAQKAGATAFALSLPDRVHDASEHAVQVAVRSLAVERYRHGILRAHVFATAAFENQPNVHAVLAMLVPVENRAAGAKVVAAIPLGDAIDRILPQIAFAGGFNHRIAADVLQFELIESNRRLDVEGYGSRILAYGCGALFRQSN